MQSYSSEIGDFERKTHEHTIAFIRNRCLEWFRGRPSCGMPSYAKQIIWWFIAGFLFSLLVVSMMGWPAAASWSYGYFLEPPDVHAT